MTGPNTAVGNAGSGLTDGTGVSPLTWKKMAKDFVADFLLTAAAATGTIQLANAFGIPTSGAEAMIVGTAIAGAFVRSLYRAVLRWATTP